MIVHDYPVADNDISRTVMGLIFNPHADLIHPSDNARHTGKLLGALAKWTESRIPPKFCPELMEIDV